MNILQGKLRQALAILLVFTLAFGYLPGVTSAETAIGIDDVKQSVEKTKDYYEANQPYDKVDYLGNPITYTGSHSDYWILSALWGAGYKDLQNDFPWTTDITPWTEDTYWTNGKDEQITNAKEAAGIIIGALLLGEDPTSFGSQNAIEDLIAKQKAEGGFTDEWGESWVLIALDLVDAEYDQEQHINAILELQNEAGSFGDIDATGWMLTALAPYKNDNEAVATAIEDAVSWAHDNFMENDEFQGEWGPNSNATAAMLMGLAAAGEDLFAEKWSKEAGSFVEQLLNYQTEEGLFEWEKGKKVGFEGATEQSLLALTTILNGQSIFVDLRENLPSVEEPEEPEEEEEGIPSTPIEPADDPDEEVPMTPLEPSTPIETEEPVEPEEVPLIPLEPSETVKEEPSEDEDEKSSVEITKDETDAVGEELPKTATNTYNYLIIGIILLVIGGIIMFIRRKQGNKQN